LFENLGNELYRAKTYDRGNYSFSPFLSLNCHAFIIPLTFYKGLQEKAIKKFWKQAYNTLTQANCIVIIGYSLPQSDYYVRSFLQTAVRRNPNQGKLSIKIINPDGKIKNRWNSVITGFEFIKEKFENTEYGKGNF